MTKQIILLVLLIGTQVFANESINYKRSPEQVKLQRSREAGFRQGCRYALLAVHHEAHQVSFETLQAKCTELLRFIKMSESDFQTRLRSVANEEQ